MNIDNPHPSPSSAEKSHVPEFLGVQNVGLQTRFLVGDLTNPKLVVTQKKLGPIQERGAQGIHKDAAVMYQGASITERRRHQRETGLTHEKWREGFDTYLEEVRQDTTHSQRKEFLETLGITETVTANDFYSEYLNGTSDVVRFADDIETQATRGQIQKHQDIIRNLGNAFGYESSEVIEHIIHGVNNVKLDIDVFVEEAKKTVNSPEVLSNPLLQKIQNDSGEEKKQSPSFEETEVMPAKAVPKKTEPSGTEQVSKTIPPAQPHHAALPIKRVDLAEEDQEPPMQRPAKTAPKMAPSKKAVSEKVPAPQPPSLPARLELSPKKKVQTQIFPAPVDKSKRTDLPLTDDELHEATQYLIFNDPRLGKTEGQAALLRESERIKYYARELHAMMQEYGSDFVLEKAVIAVLSLNKDLIHLGLKSDSHSKNSSWYLRGIAKSRFLQNNPDIQVTLPNAEKYVPVDPLLHTKEGLHSSVGKLSQKADEEIIEGMLGWEIYRQRKKVDDIIFRLDPLMAPAEKRKLRELLALPPKKDVSTLSSFQLREIGHLVRTNIIRQ